jgi:hypothetical protein
MPPFQWRVSPRTEWRLLAVLGSSRLGVPVRESPSLDVTPPRHRPYASDRCALAVITGFISATRVHDNPRPHDCTASSARPHGRETNIERSFVLYGKFFFCQLFSFLSNALWKPAANERTTPSLHSMLIGECDQHTSNQSVAERLSFSPR